MMPFKVSKNQERRWFIANQVHLAIDASPIDPVVQHLHDSVLLSQHEPLLAVLAAAFNTDYDWQPVIIDEVVPELTHTIELMSEQSLSLGVCLPHEFNESLSTVATDLKTVVNVSQHHQPWSFQLPEIVLSTEESENLKIPGAILVIPSSANGELVGNLVCDEQRISCQLNAKELTIALTSGSVKHDDDITGTVATPSVLSRCEVRWNGSNAVDQRQFGSNSIIESATHTFQLNPTSQVEVALHDEDKQTVHTHADLISLGNGLGLRIAENPWT